MSLLQKAQILDPKCWPPGALMQFKTPAGMPDPHFGIGIVVANRNGSIAVLWDRKCEKPFLVYKVASLNSQVISRIAWCHHRE